MVGQPNANTKKWMNLGFYDHVAKNNLKYLLETVLLLDYNASIKINWSTLWSIADLLVCHHANLRKWKYQYETKLAQNGNYISANSICTFENTFWLNLYIEKFSKKTRNCNTKYFAVYELTPGLFLKISSIQINIILELLE